MNNGNLYLGNTLLHGDSKPVSMETVEVQGEKYFKIENYNEMNPFFMTIVSDVDFWMFISSTGGLTCGRKNAESALFPYYTDDKIHDSNETTGSHTMLIISKDEKRFLWKPFTSHNADVYQITRNMYKNTLGNKIMFEEVNHDLNVSFSYTWKTSDEFGFIKESMISNLGSELKVEVLDGIRNLLPYGINTLIQTTKSTLADGYKRCELNEEAGLGIYTLSSILTDKAEPSESLKSTTVWTSGLENPTYLLSELQVEAFCMGRGLETEHDIKGRRGAFYVADKLVLAEGAKKSWLTVAELNQNASKVEALIDSIKNDNELVEALNTSVLRGDENLKKLVFEADGLQLTADEKAGYRHFSNTLYNIMRGGIYADGYDIVRDDFKEFVLKWNKGVYKTFESFINELPAIINYNDLLKEVATLGNADFERLVFEYLPLTYSRRHGDPSRPWNRFSIEVTKENGEKNLNFEGNWRDIFQNWEALSVSYPNYIESIIAKFVNASTADGYNPYRITKDGIDWEVIDPEDPWSNIGYWGDHQLIYLLKLMELSKKYNPEKLIELLDKDIFAYANVPYRIKGFNELVKDPRNSILFDDELEETIEKNLDVIGSDAKLMSLNDEVYKVNLMEKLLVTLLSKFSNYVPEGGIWMNTQRPEWNDANNALVGYGLSMVTLYYLNRFQNFMNDLVKDVNKDSIMVSSEVVTMFESTLKVLVDYKDQVNTTMTNELRFEIVSSLGKNGEAYRESIYKDGFTGDKKPLSMAALNEFVEVSMIHLKDSIKKNKREDGLYHAYNLISFDQESCQVSYLYEMLEGQVAVLSSKALDRNETLNVLKSLRTSSIYREDQNSYMLYPNRELPEFLVKNVIPEEVLMTSTVLKNEIESGNTRFVERDINGKYHFNGAFRNGEDIREAMIAVGEFSSEEIAVVEEMFTNLFNHHSFTGRSGTFYKYEGLGCIYWHMVSKLLLTAQENFFDAFDGNLDTQVLEYMESYEAIKDGIGAHKTPVEYGAFPTDAYSHTPGFAGVQQPGMTGQVKEDFITRLRELGVDVFNGQVVFNPILLKKSEFLNETKVWSLPTSDITLAENTLGFTFGTVPVIYSLTNVEGLTVEMSDGTTKSFETNKLSKDLSQNLFNRDGEVKLIKVNINSNNLK